MVSGCPAASSNVTPTGFDTPHGTGPLPRISSGTARLPASVCSSPTVTATWSGPQFSAGELVGVGVGVSSTGAGVGLGAGGAGGR